MKLEHVGLLTFTISFLVTPSPGSHRTNSTSWTAAANAADYDSLMRDGVQFRRTGDDAAALKVFQQAYELNKTPRALVQVGLAEQALGRWTAADTHLRQALESQSDPWLQRNRSTIDSALAVVAAHVGQLEVSGTPTGAEVRVDGELVGRLPLARPISVTAGGVAVEVRAAGYLPIVRAASISARTLTRETFNLQSLSPVPNQGTGAEAHVAAQPPGASTEPGDRGSPPGAAADGANSGAGGPADPAPRSADGRSGRRILMLAAGGLALGSLAFGVIEHLSWQSKVSSFGSMSACGTALPQRGGPGCKALYDDGQSARTLALVGYAVTAAFAATAVILYVTEPDGGSSPGTVACAPVPATNGLACAIRF